MFETFKFCATRIRGLMETIIMNIFELFTAEHNIYEKDNKKRKFDVVVVKGDKPLPRNRWPLGRVIKLITGQKTALYVGQN